jgi:hypothetical protein
MEEKEERECLYIFLTEYGHTGTINVKVWVYLIAIKRTIDRPDKKSVDWLFFGCREKPSQVAQQLGRLSFLSFS